MTIGEFHVFTDRIVEKLWSKTRENITFITSCRSGDDFELCVVAAINDIVSEEMLPITVHHTPGSHSFPDIVIECNNGAKYGIEVKSSSSRQSGWKINGNSVLGSTRDDDVIETYVVFGKTNAANIGFRAKRYEDCVANVVVTHSPRYYIDMDIEHEHTFFARSGIPYSTIKESNNPISLITDYYRSEGMQAWWLTEATPAALRMFSDLSEDEKIALFAYGIAHYPELLGSSSNKYRRFAVWLATDRSVVSPSLRDEFSAGGKVDLKIGNTSFNRLPQVYNRINMYRDRIIASIYAEDPAILAELWGTDFPGDKNDDKLEKWISVVSAIVPQSQLPEDVTADSIIRTIMLQ